MDVSHLDIYLHIRYYFKKMKQFVQAPPFSFSLIGVQIMYRRQPPLFTAEYFPCTLTSIPLTGTSFSQMYSISQNSFVQNGIINRGAAPKSPADSYYNESGGDYRARLLGCVPLILNTGFV